ncbi:MAG TPA: hypothetical protein VF816_14625 [Rhodocyclaceae bacterium]
MGVIRFPHRGNAVRRAEEDFREPSFDSRDTEGDEARYPLGDDLPAPPEELRCEEAPAAAARAAVRTGRRPSPADILAQSVAPGPGSRRPRLTPAQVLAQSLSPAPAAASPEFLQQSFWEIWLQHRAYLKKKACTFSTSAARRPTTS